MLAHLDMRHAASRDVVGGILRFAAVHQSWEVQFAGAHPSNESLDYFADWHPDALIIDGSCNSLDRKGLASIAGRAAVFVNKAAPSGWRKPYALLTTDDQLLAKEAAALFCRKGLKHFAFVGSPAEEPWSATRQTFFNAELKGMGFALQTFTLKCKTRSWSVQQQELAAWLKSLPKPCGVWAAFDQRAKHVLDACHVAGLDVPRQIQVLGVDNETYICEQTVPSISSLMPDFENGGFAAAEFLATIVQGKNKPGNQCTVIHFSLKGVVERLSTADVNGTARHVAATQEIIRKHAVGGIDVPYIAASLGVSVRLLQRDYRAVTGRTVLSDIISEKLKHVREMLRKTTTPIDSIGPFCGFKSSAHLKTLFKKRFGMTMRAYRASS